MNEFSAGASADIQRAAGYRRDCKALRDRGELDAALASIRRVLDNRPDNAQAHFERADVLRDLGRWEKALGCYDRALTIRNAGVHSNRGVVLQALRRLDEARDSYDAAIALEPGLASAYFNRAMLRLSLGDLERGWRDYEWRWEDQGSIDHRERCEFAQPCWRGDEPIAGRTILLYGEQGDGDTLQFCRYVPLLADLGARVILEARAPLASLLAGLQGLTQLVPRGSRLPDFDYQCPLMSLPLAFRTTLESIPLAGGCLSSDTGKADEWRAKLGPKNKPRVGLAWSGNRAHVNDRQRSIPLAQLIEKLPGDLQYVALQTGARAGDRPALDAADSLLDVSSALCDFNDAAALCECIDLVIAVDTSVAHLSAALGQRTWILLPRNPDWRWLIGRDDSPWYRSVMLYRQTAGDAWNEVLERIHLVLRTFQFNRTSDCSRGVSAVA